jgi:type VI secretion system protein ImpK
MSNLYLDCAGPLLETLAHLDGADENPPDGPPWRHRILEDLQQFTLRAQARGLPGKGVQDARYALAVLVDERVMSRTDTLAEHWTSEPLQVFLFGEYRGGEGFFEHLAALRQHPGDHLDLLELYLCCLHLGLEGVYRVRGPERLESLKSDLREQVRQLRESEAQPSAAASSVDARSRKRAWPVQPSVRGISLTLLALIPVVMFFHGWQLHTLAQDLGVRLESHTENLSRIPLVQPDEWVQP